MPAHQLLPRDSEPATLRQQFNHCERRLRLLMVGSGEALLLVVKEAQVNVPVLEEPRCSLFDGVEGP